MVLGLLPGPLYASPGGDSLCSHFLQVLLVQLGQPPEFPWDEKVKPYAGRQLWQDRVQGLMQAPLLLNVEKMTCSS